MDVLGHRQLLPRARKVESYHRDICPAEFFVEEEVDVADHQ